MKRNENNEQKNRKKETWKFWDVIFFGGSGSLLNEASEAEKDNKKFKQLIYKSLFGIVFAGVLFGVVYSFVAR